jgi:asparagine synthase (glutamine-hydrolysing)
MCGIFGAFRLDTAQAAPVVNLTAMARVLHHRGPDGMATARLGGCAMGFTRLALVAPHETAEVPMFGRVMAVANAEIYNHLDLRRQLPPSHRPLSDTDTAIIPALYAQHGPHFVERVRGMYALAIFDGVRQAFHLLRDPAGKKPLFYAVVNSMLVFASEQKAVLAAVGSSPRLKYAALQRAFLRGFLDENESILEGLMALPPGAHLVADATGIRVGAPRLLDVTDREDSFDEAVKRTANLVEQAVLRRKARDVAAVTCLSSGADSGIVASLAALPCVTLAMPGRNEAPAAGKMARRSGLTMETVWPVSPTRASLRRALWHLEVPDMGATWEMATATLCLARHLQTHGVKVALTGEGADEAFLGYPWHRVDAALRGLWRFPSRDPLVLSHPNILTAFMLTRRAAPAWHAARAMEVWRQAAQERRFPEMAALAHGLFP